MLKTLHKYALELLGSCGELEQLRYWHVWYYLKIAEAARKRCREGNQFAHLERLAEEKGNLRAALEWTW